MLAKVTVSQGLKSLRNESGWGIPWRSSGWTPRFHCQGPWFNSWLKN